MLETSATAGVDKEHKPAPHTGPISEGVRDGYLVDCWNAPISYSPNDLPNGRHGSVAVILPQTRRLAAQGVKQTLACSH